MSAMVVPLEPIEYAWAESASPRMREQGRSVVMPIGVLPRGKDSALAGVVDRLRTVAAIVWFGWLIAAGLVVGGAALVAVVRIAWAILGWAVAL